MEQRYQILDAASVMDIEEYNKTAEQPLSHHIVIIDEVHRPTQEDADWNRAEMFKLQLTSIAKQGRAAGVHLVLCTQSFDKVGLDAVRGQVRLRIGLRLDDINDCAALMGINSGNNAMATLPDFTAVYNAHLGETKHNRRVVLDEITPADLKQRLATLKQRYPSAVTANAMPEVIRTEPPVNATTNNSDIPAWLL